MPVAPIVAIQLASDKAVSGLPGAIFLLVGALSALWAGKLMEQYGRLNILRVAIFIGALGALVCYIGEVSQMMIVFLLGLALLGFSSAVIVLSRVMIIEIFPMTEQSKVMGYVFSGAVLGGIIGPFIGFLSTSVDFERSLVAWLSSCILFVLALIISLIPKKDSMEVAKYLKNENTAGTKIETPLAESNRAIIFLGIIAGATGHGLMVALMSICGAIMKEKGIDLSIIYLAMGLHFISMFGFMPLVARLYNKIGFQRTVFIAFVIYLLCFMLFGISSSAVHYVMVLMLLGIGWAMCFLSSTMLISSHASPKEKIKYIARNDFFSALTGASITIMSGFILKEGGQEFLALFLVMFLPIIFFSVIMSGRREEAII
jgi:MFS family permease